MVCAVLRVVVIEYAGAGNKAEGLNISRIMVVNFRSVIIMNFMSACVVIVLTYASGHCYCRHERKWWCHR